MATKRTMDPVLLEDQYRTYVQSYTAHPMFKKTPSIFTSKFQSPFTPTSKPINYQIHDTCKPHQHLPPPTKPYPRPSFPKHHLNPTTLHISQTRKRQRRTTSLSVPHHLPPQTLHNVSTHTLLQKKANVAKLCSEHVLWLVFGWRGKKWVGVFFL